MKRKYISPVCEGFLAEQEVILAGSVIISSGAGDYNPDLPTPGVEEGDVDPNGFAKGGMVWDNTIFD